MAQARQRQPQPTDVKNKGGRPTSFRPRFTQLAYQFALLGATDKQMAEFFGVAESTFNLWKQRQKGFSESIKKGKAEADAIIAASLFHRAKGYTHKAVKILQHEGSSYEHEYTEHYPPDATAAIFWLKNRQPELWRDKQHVEHGGRIGGGPATVEEMSIEQIDAELAKRKAKQEAASQGA